MNDPRPKSTPRPSITSPQSNSDTSPAVGSGNRTVKNAQLAGAMSTETFIVDFLASVKITPLTGGTSP